MNIKLPTNKLDAKEFAAQAMQLFQYQAIHVPIYAQFLKYLGIVNPVQTIKKIEEIPFLPISFFKTHNVIVSGKQVQETFTSSGTTGSITSKHLVADVNLYTSAHRIGFKNAYGNIGDYTILALLPSYLERSGSSLIAMVQDMIEQSGNSHSGFYLHNLAELRETILDLERQQKTTLLIGVSYALLDLLELGSFTLKHTIIMETGGMKGKRKEMVKEELHQVLQKGFGVKNIHSEYGMTELLSQAYSKGKGFFETSPSMEILIRDVNDPLCILPNNYTGGINVIDLANINSCAFIATQDLGKKHTNGTFEVLGRFDNSDIRGCNLMIG